VVILLEDRSSIFIIMCWLHCGDTNFDAACAVEIRMGGLSGRSDNNVILIKG